MSFGTLYTHQPNPRSTAILGIAKAHGLKLDLVFAEESNKENYEKLLKINPLGQVPVFVGADGYVLTECIAIALYITSQSETTTLLGHCRRDYFTILKWMSFANSDLLPAIGGVLIPMMGRTLSIRKNSEDCLRAFYTDIAVLEKQLQGSKYLIGDQISLADYFVAGELMGAFMVFHKVLSKEYPSLTKWFWEVYEGEILGGIWGKLRLLEVPVPVLPAERS